MKKIYLLTMGLMAFVVTSMGQSCPPTPTAFKYTISSPVPHCVVILNNANSEPDWYMSLVDFDGNLIPLWGTGPGTGNPAQYYVAINASTGSASFYYDCDNPGFVDVEYVNFVRFPAGSPVVICQTTPAPGGSLPVKLTSFTGRLQNDNSVVLDWASVIETDSYKYEVQRSSDGKYFETVGHLNAAGSSNSTIKYTFTDKLSSPGAYFYRLKQIDIDAKFEYSKVVYVNSKKGSGIITKVFPNPFKGEVQLIGATSSDLTPNNVKVFSISGQRITYRFMGANSILIDPSAPDGVYILQVKDQRFKLVKNPSGTSY